VFVPVVVSNVQHAAGVEVNEDFIASHNYIFVKLAEALYVNSLSLAIKSK